MENKLLPLLIVNRYILATKSADFVPLFIIILFFIY